MHGYQYDDAGNLEVVTGPGTASYTYTYTAAGPLATYGPTGGSATLTNTWDADSNRVSFTAVVCSFRKASLRQTKPFYSMYPLLDR